MGDVSSVKYMWRIFYGATVFGMRLCNWNTQNLADMNELFDGSNCDFRRCLMCTYAPTSSPSFALLPSSPPSSPPSSTPTSIPTSISSSKPSFSSIPSTNPSSPLAPSFIPSNISSFSPSVSSSSSYTPTYRNITFFPTKVSSSSYVPTPTSSPSISSSKPSF